MLSIILYAFGIMYTPGPVNALSMSNGMQRKLSRHFPFSLGVGAAIFIWFIVVGYTGSAIITPTVLPVIATLGTGFILYLAYKILSSKVDTTKPEETGVPLHFRDGLLMQLLNPKCFLLVFPIATVQFPTLNISGIEIAVWSLLLGTMGVGAPFSYAAFGSTVARKINNFAILQYINRAMGILLVIVAVEMAYSQIYLPVLN